MGVSPKTAPVVAHGGNPQDRATSLHRWLTLNSEPNYTRYLFINVLSTRKTNDSLPTKEI
ncbi:MAG: hypothetical protein F6K65_29230 [Moorea sp. SIO3C2]|nr:hypothetical protein [Moorena sp. SIO3C2]